MILLPSWHWLKNAIQPLHFIASHHICWPFCHSLTCSSSPRFLIYCEFYFSYLHYTSLLCYFLLKTISHFIPFASVETTLPSCSHLSLFLFTMLFSIPSISCSDLLALPCILYTQSIQSTHAKIFNGLFLAKSQNLYSVFISVTWQLPSILPPVSFSSHIILPWWFNFLLVLLQTIYLLILLLRFSFQPHKQNHLWLNNYLVYISIPPVFW